MTPTTLERLEKALRKIPLFSSRKEMMAPETKIWFYGGDGGSLDLDDLDFICWLTNVEKEFGVKIPPAELNEVNTVGDVVAILQKHGVQ